MSKAKVLIVLQVSNMLNVPVFKYKICFSVKGTSSFQLCTTRSVNIVFVTKPITVFYLHSCFFFF